MEETDDDPPALDGWDKRQSAAFGSLVGPLWTRREPGNDGSVDILCGFYAGTRHGNRRGVVHGGMLATLADTALGIVAAEQVNGQPIATVQLNLHYVDAVRPGEFVIARSEVTRVTKTLIFLRGRLTAAHRTVVMADGIWKILRSKRQ